METPAQSPSSKPSQAAESALQRVLQALGRITETREVWPQGLLNPGGPHRRLRGEHFPISIGDDECRVFGRLVDRFEPRTAFIIGNAFGLSSAYIAEMMRQHGGERVITLDSQSEGNGTRCAGIAQELTEALGLSEVLVNKKGYSPQDVPEAVEHDAYDLVFIDGLHRHPQVVRDFDAVRPYLDDTSIVVWHDGWIRGVPESVRHAEKLGWRCLWLPTSCEMIVGCKDAQQFERLQEVFPEGETHHRRRSYLMGYLRHLQTSWTIRKQLAHE